MKFLRFNPKERAAYDAHLAMLKRRSDEANKRQKKRKDILSEVNEKKKIKRKVRKKMAKKSRRANRK